MDQGVIRSLKAKYRTRVIKRIIAAIGQGKQAMPISILEAMKSLCFLGVTSLQLQLLTVSRKEDSKKPNF